jgi:hypothetical protein
MQNSFAATGILRTSRADGATPDETLDVEFCDALGRVSVVRVTPDMAATRQDSWRLRVASHERQRSGADKNAGKFRRRHRSLR